MNQDPVIRRTVIRHTVQSQLLPEGFRNTRVYLPPGYQETVSYPVVYCQDGEQFFNYGRIATIAQKMILEEDWDPFIVVGVDVDLKHRSAEYKPGGSRFAAYTRFFAEELLPDIEKHFSVRRTAKDRVLAGDSLGAAVSLSLALTYPDLYCRVLSLSGAYFESYLQQARDYFSLKWLHIWMIVGLQETAFENDEGVFDMVAMNRKMKRILEERNAKLIYEEKDGEHKWGFWQNELPRALSCFLGPEPRL
jgi:enterochelin esterase-like enzyme